MKYINIKYLAVVFLLIQGCKSEKNNFSKDILTLGVPNRFVDHGPRDVLLEEIGLDSVTLYENIFNFIKKIND